VSTLVFAVVSVLASTVVSVRIYAVARAISRIFFFPLFLGGLVVMGIVITSVSAFVAGLTTYRSC
jgi:hypothetical protein